MRFDLELFLVRPVGSDPLAMLEGFNITVVGDNGLLSGQQKISRESIFRRSGRPDVRPLPSFLVE
jgi:hypothetical protein